MVRRRGCEQCGAAFEPRREHERFCSARCGVDWNGRDATGSSAGDAALGWSVTAMDAAVRRLALTGPAGAPHALAVISEAVWWVTIVDATVIRCHSASREQALARLDPAARKATEGAFAGLRFVRSQLGYFADPSDFLQPPPGAGDVPPAAWTWRQVPVTSRGAVPPRGRAWEVSRHRDHQAHLAGRPAGDTIGRAAAFLAGV
jgi:hypothetical protein